MVTLLVGLPPAPVEGGCVALADKTLSGLAALAARWPGRVVATLTAEKVPPSANLGVGWHAIDSLHEQIEICAPAVAIERVKPDVVQLPLSAQSLPLVRLAPVVVVAENTAMMKFQYAALTAPKSDIPRMLAGALRQERVHRTVARRAEAVACNGWGAWSAYGGHRRGAGVQPILFFDNRIRIGDVQSAGDRSRRSAGRRLSLAFSGRLHPSKGPEFAIEASRALDNRKVDHTLHVLGEGPLGPGLRQTAGPSVRFHGDLPFRTEWIPFVRDNVDLMLLPHLQGDPSGTYLECAALGVPVLGFDNAAMRGHEAHGGFALRSRRRSSASLADLVERVGRSPETFAELSIAGPRFLERESMDAEFDRRVDQLLRVAARAGS